jgi:phenylpropionate dioxygenase-like ring-hydroxylating dioxygenase large terminal subunit
MALTLTKPYEDLLGDAVERLMGDLPWSATKFVAGLNQANVHGPNGQAWTEELFLTEMARLGAGERERVNFLENCATARSNKIIAQPFSPKAATPEQLLETGLLNLWYVIARSEDVTDRPVGLKRLGRNLALWRGQNGELNVVEDYCPHRGAPLSMGRVVEGTIACPYHGIQINGEGCVMAVPASPDSPMVGQKAIKAYPSREHLGAIWAYFGDADHEHAPEPIFPEELSSDEWSGFLVTLEWQCNWLLAVDNRTDPIHGSFLHEGNTFTLASGRMDARLKVSLKPNGFETERDNQRGVNLDWHEVFFQPGNTFWIRTEVPYPAAVGEGSFRVVGMITPIDRNSTYFWGYRSRKISGFGRDLWRFMYKNRFGARGDSVVAQDQVLLETLTLDNRRREDFIQTDVAVVRMRKMLLAEAAKQLQAATGEGAAATQQVTAPSNSQPAYRENS